MKALLLFLGLSLLLLLPRAVVMPLMDRDEPKFAQAAREMAQRGEWVTPYFNNAYRFDKPVLVYWMMRASCAVFGDSEAAARLHSLACAGLTAWLIFLMGSRWFGREAGWSAGLAWLLTVQVLIHGQLCVADMALMLGIVMTQFGLWEILRTPFASKFGGWFWLMVTGITLGFLAKGPLAFVVPVLGWLLALWPLKMKPESPRAGSLFLAILIGLGIAACWGIPALIQTHGAYFDKGIGEHVVERGLKSFNGRVKVPGVYYLFTSIFVFLPWTAWFIGVAKQKAPEPVHCFLWGWLLAPFLIFSFYSTQLPHYVLPSLPAYLLLLFSTGKLPELKTKMERGWRTCLLWVTGALVVGALVVGCLYPVSGSDAEMKRLILGVAGWLGGVVAVVVFAVRAWKLWWLGPVVLLLAASGWQAAVALRGLNPVLRSRIVTGENPAGTYWLGCRFFEPSLVYYTNRFWTDAKKFPAAARLLSKHQGPEVAVFMSRTWSMPEWIAARLRDAEAKPDEDYRDQIILPGSPQDWETETVVGLNGARFEWNEILVARRNLVGRRKS